MVAGVAGVAGVASVVLVVVVVVVVVDVVVEDFGRVGLSSVSSEVEGDIC